jgi:hypothetical protein
VKLTQTEWAWLAAFERLERGRGIPPTLLEVGSAIERTKGGANYLALRLESLGLVTHEPRAARSWRLTERGRQLMGSAARPEQSSPPQESARDDACAPCTVRSPALVRQ